MEKKLSEINPCITPEMESFLDTMASTAKGYLITELNDSLETCGGFCSSLSPAEIKKCLEDQIGAQDVNIIKNEEGEGYSIYFFVGERDRERKNGCIRNIEFRPGGES